jgi:hypothetical protein
VSAERFLRDSRVLPEILESAVRGSVFGRVCVARARRSGGSCLWDRRATTASSGFCLLRDEGVARTILVDGAINRITQVASWPGARFVFTIRTDRSTADKAARQARRMGAWSPFP